MSAAPLLDFVGEQSIVRKGELLTWYVHIAYICLLARPPIYPKRFDEMNAIVLSLKEKYRFLSLFIIVQLIGMSAGAQMRQVYVNSLQENSAINKISFYSSAQGVVAFNDCIGLTTDTGRTFIKRYITGGNVDYDGYPVNLTFGFEILGAIAFDQNNLLVYGDYGLVPSILSSTDGGLTYKLIFHSRPDIFKLKSGITDMVFPQNNAIGYAIDADRILRSNTGGASWSVKLMAEDYYFEHLQAIDNNNLIAFSTKKNKLVKTADGGNTWQTVTFPAGFLRYAHFITPAKGWVNVSDLLYYTSNAGLSWKAMNNPAQPILTFSKIEFVNDSTGYAIGGSAMISKTTDSGKIWEPLYRQTNPPYNDIQYNELSFWSDQQGWVGGNRFSLLELTSNGGGVPLPKALFTLDTTGVAATNLVQLVNHSKTTYQYKWFKNDTLISTAYHSSYLHNVDREADTILLVVSNGIYSDTLKVYQWFKKPVPPPLPVITKFSPTTGGSGILIWIDGLNFTGTTAVTIGGVPVTRFSILNENRIEAVVGNGATGKVAVTSIGGTAEWGTFTFIEAPVITSFTPLHGNSLTTVTIHGTNFTAASVVYFGDVPAASVTVESPTLIKAVPAYAGASGTVSVYTLGGLGSLGTFTYDYPPQIGAVVPGFGPVGTEVTISGTWFTGATALSLEGVPVTAFTVVDDKTIKATIAPGPSGTFTITTPNGSHTGGGFEVKLPPAITSFTPATGTNGTIIYITGTNILEATGITIGGMPAASFTFTAPNIMAATVGANASGNIVITTPYGSATKGAFTWMPAPVITSFTPAAGTAGTEITISGNNFDSVTQVTFGEQLASSFKIVSGTTIKAVVHLGASGAVVLKAFGATFSAQGFTHIPTASPIITSYTPKAGPVGTPVTITGNHFSPNIAGNTVFFGAVKANITQATENSLTVLVPTGATWQPMTVASNYRTGMAAQPFIVTNPGASGITPALFNDRKDFSGANPLWNGMVHADFDGDGLPDLLAQGLAGIYRNTSSNGLVSFTLQPVEMPYLGNISALAAGDLDGDGKIDIVATDWFREISVLRNVGDKGVFKFERTILTTELSTTKVCIADITGDGLPDIIVGHLNEVALFRNTTTGGQLSFESSGTRLPVPVSFQQMEIADIDQDGKPDVIVTGDDLFTYTQGVVVFRNIYVVNGPAFTPVLFPGRNGNTLAIADFDGDGKQDIITPSFSYDSLQVYRNISTPGVVSLAARIGFPTNGRAQQMLTNDMDGDGKSDLAIIYLNKDSVTLHRNLSVSGNFSFDKGVSFPLSGLGTALSLGDLNADGRIDLAASSENAVISVFSNFSNIGKTDTLRVCVGADTMITSTIAGASYQWQQDAGTGFSNMVNNANIAGVNARILQLNDIPAAWKGYQYRCIVDGATSTNKVVLQVADTVTPVITIAGTAILNQGTPAVVKATVSKAGNAPVMQWQQKISGGAWTDIPGANKDSLTHLVEHTGDQLRCVLTSTAPCAVPKTVTSNAISFVVNAVTAIDPEPAANYGIKYFPSPVQAILFIRDLKLSDQWETLELTSLEGKQKIISRKINGQSMVDLQVGQLSQGIYIAVLKNRSGKSVYLKFVKM